MNWRSIKLLTDDDIGKPLLLRSPYDHKCSYVYFCGHVVDGCVFKSNYFDGGGFFDVGLLDSLDELSSETQYIRIDEIRD